MKHEWVTTRKTDGQRNEQVENERKLEDDWLVSSGERLPLPPTHRSVARSDERQRSTGLEDSDENIRNMNQSHMDAEVWKLASRGDGGRFCWIITSGSSRQVLSFFLYVLSWRWLQLYFRKGLIKTSRYGATHWLHWSSRWWQKSRISRKLEALLPQTLQARKQSVLFPSAQHRLSTGLKGSKRKCDSTVSTLHVVSATFKCKKLKSTSKTPTRGVMKAGWGVHFEHLLFITFSD